MKFSLLLFAIVAVIAGFGSAAHAQNYPWCAYYGGRFGGGGGTNCGFVSFEQCMATVHGIGGFCDRDTQYVPPAGVSGGQPRRKTQRPS